MYNGKRRPKPQKHPLKQQKLPQKRLLKLSRNQKTVTEEVAEPVVTEPVEVTTEVSEEQSLLNDYTNLSLKCQQAAVLLSSMKKELLALEKKTNRVLRAVKNLVEKKI